MSRHVGFVVEKLGERFETATTHDFAVLALSITLIAWFFTKYFGD